MWHGTGTYLTSLDFLLEVIHRDVHPEVTVQVNDDGVDSADGIKDGTQMIIVADLSSILLTLQAQLLADELVAESFPVILRISYMMSIVITGSTTKLSCKLASLQ